MDRLSSLLDAKRRFFGLGPSLEEADVVILPVPYDATASYLKGTSKGPAAILDASDQLEEYDVELGFSICDRLSICTLKDLPVSGKSPEEMVKAVEEVVAAITKQGKKPVVLGGEHSLTAGAVAGLNDPSVSVLQIDAHADMRDDYQGTKHSHACVMRRVRGITGNVVQAGIRSMSKEEADYIKKNGLEKSIFHGRPDIDGILSQLGDKVYVTIDVDAFDPSVMPGTGTPEPGGLLWDDVLSLIRAVSKEKEVVGFDITEVLPVPPLHITEFTAAKLAYKMMGYFWAKPG
jgi:agmatinase